MKTSFFFVTLTRLNYKTDQHAPNFVGVIEKNISILSPKNIAKYKNI